MDKQTILMVVFLVAMLMGLGLVISVLVQQFRKMQREKQETGYYSYNFFYMIGALIGAPISVLLNRLFIPKWVYEEPFNPFLTAIPIVVVMYLAGHITVLLNRKKIRPLTPRQEKSQILGLVLMLVMVSYVIVTLVRH